MSPCQEGGKRRESRGSIKNNKWGIFFFPFSCSLAWRKGQCKLWAFSRLRVACPRVYSFFLVFLQLRLEVISTYDSVSPCLGMTRCEIIASDKIGTEQSTPPAAQVAGNAYLMGLSNWIFNSRIRKEKNIYDGCMAQPPHTVTNNGNRRSWMWSWRACIATSVISHHLMSLNLFFLSIWFWELT